MTLFDERGHITSEGFLLLLHGEPDELQRLELSEHLSFCDACLGHYMEYLEKEPLMIPNPSQKKEIFYRAKSCRLILFQKRFAVAAAACITVLLWSGGVFQWQNRLLTKNPTGHLAEQVYMITQKNTTYFSDILSEKYINVLQKLDRSSYYEKGVNDNGKK